MASWSQRTQYIRVLNAIGFYSWHFKGSLDTNWRFQHLPQVPNLDGADDDEYSDGELLGFAVAPRSTERPK